MSAAFIAWWVQQQLAQVELQQFELMPDHGRKPSKMQQVWAAYEKHHPTARLTNPRRQLINRRLADYGVERLIAAIDGCHLSPWHRGENPQGRKFLDLELILRDAAHIETYEQFSAKTGAAPSSPQPQPKTAAEWKAQRAKAQEAQ